MKRHIAREDEKNKDVDKYLSLADYLVNYLSSHHLAQAAVIRESNLNRNYAYPIFNGSKSNPHRDYIIAIGLACHMSYSELQRVLKIAGAGILYAKDSRDALITLCINEKIYDITKVNEQLLSYGFEGLKGTYI